MKTPAQDRWKKRIDQLTKQITTLTSLRESDFSDVSKTKVDEVRKKLHKEELELKKLQRKAMRQRELCKKRRDGIQKLCDEESKAKETLKSFNRTETGRLRIEVDQPQVLSVIVNIVRASFPTDDRRHSELLRSIISKVS